MVKEARSFAISQRLRLDGLKVKLTCPIFLNKNYALLELQNTVILLEVSTFTILAHVAFTGNLQEIRIQTVNGLTFLYALTDDKIFHCHAIDLSKQLIALVPRYTMRIEEFSNDFFIDGDCLFVYQEKCIGCYNLQKKQKFAELVGFELAIEYYEWQFEDCKCYATVDTYTDFLDELDSGKVSNSEKRLQMYEELGCYCASCSNYIKSGELEKLLIAHAFSMAYNNKEIQWEYSKIAIFETKSEICLVLYGKIPEITIYVLSVEQAQRDLKNNTFAIIKPCEHIRGLIQNSWLEESLLGGEMCRSSIFECDLFADDINELEILDYKDEQLSLLIYSDIYGLLYLNVVIAEENKQFFEVAKKTYLGNFNEHNKQKDEYFDIFKNIEKVGEYYYVLASSNTILKLKQDSEMEVLEILSDGKSISGFYIDNETLYCWNDEEIIVIQM